MHLFLGVTALAAAYFKGDWRHLKKYGMTIYYVITANLLYNVLCHDYLLWKYTPDILPNSHIIVDLIYSFIILPSITLIFLTHYPFGDQKLKQVVFICLWVAGSLAVMFPFYKLGRITFQHGYEYWMDFFFYSTMYSMLRLHHTRPFLTYCCSIVVIVLLMLSFKVPLE